MSSICVEDLVNILQQYPEDYEVIFEVRELVDGKPKTSIAYINGIRADNEYREIRLMN